MKRSTGAILGLTAICGAAWGLQTSEHTFSGTVDGSGYVAGRYGFSSLVDSRQIVIRDSGGREGAFDVTEQTKSMTMAEIDDMSRGGGDMAVTYNVTNARQAYFMLLSVPEITSFPVIADTMIFKPK